MQIFQELTLKYKLRHTDQWKSLPQGRNQYEEVAYEPLYETPLQIDKSKYNSLKSLSQYMHKDFHNFYENLSQKI